MSLTQKTKKWCNYMPSRRFGKYSFQKCIHKRYFYSSSFSKKVWNYCRLGWKVGNSDFAHYLAKGSKWNPILKLTNLYKRLHEFVCCCFKTIINLLPVKRIQETQGKFWLVKISNQRNLPTISFGISKTTILRFFP